MRDAFYGSIQPVENFEQLADSTSYVPLPEGWSIVAADIKASTKAIEGGRYKEVNTVGVSVIAAVRNVLTPVEVPYVFGGDGAVLCIPDRFVPAAGADGQDATRECVGDDAGNFANLVVVGVVSDVEDLVEDELSGRLERKRDCLTDVQYMH